jgi:hypothetical protein
MKLNTWQWVGLVVFLLALAVVLWKELSGGSVTGPAATRGPTSGPVQAAP